ALADLPLELPRETNGDHVWHLYVVQTKRRDALRAHLEREGVETGLHYPVPLHRQPALAQLGFERLEFPVAERIAAECLSLPLFSGLTQAEHPRVIGPVPRFLGCPSPQPPFP